MYRKPQPQGGELGRVRTPRQGEVLGLIEATLGANRLKIRCQDNKMRTCRIPGKLRKRVWMHEGELVLVRPWIIQGEDHGDAIWKYTAAQVDWLRRRGLLTMTI